MATSILQQIGNILLPKKKTKDMGTAQTPTFDIRRARELKSVPQYRDHLDDIFDLRVNEDARSLMKTLFKQDSDVSATVDAFLTVAGQCPMHWIVRDENGVVDHQGLKEVNAIIRAMTMTQDYTQGFQFKPGLRQINEEFRYMILLRGGIMAELLLDKLLIPAGLRNIDLASIRWREPKPGQYKPVQIPEGSNQEINLDLPYIFVEFYRRDPTEIYTNSHFVSSINTIASRQQVMNDLYRIMKKTGYGRITVKVLEEVLRKSAPASAQQNEEEMAEWLNDRRTEIESAVANMEPDQALVHFDSIEFDMLNTEGPGKSMDVRAVIEVLNAANQAALKVLPTLIGRGESGVNTASVETRVFSMRADSINQVVAEIWSRALTLALRLTGSTSVVEVRFAPAELRPDTELEPQRAIKQARMLALLSRGLILDDEFHMEVLGRPRPDSVPELSGTNFEAPTPQADIDSISPNSDPLGRSVTPEGSKEARSNGNK